MSGGARICRSRRSRPDTASSVFGMRRSRSASRRATITLMRGVLVALALVRADDAGELHQLRRVAREHLGHRGRARSGSPGGVDFCALQPASVSTSHPAKPRRSARRRARRSCCSRNRDMSLHRPAILRAWRGCQQARSETPGSMRRRGRRLHAASPRQRGRDAEENQLPTVVTPKYFYADGQCRTALNRSTTRTRPTYPSGPARGSLRAWRSHGGVRIICLVLP